MLALRKAGADLPILSLPHLSPLPVKIIDFHDLAVTLTLERCAPKLNHFHILPKGTQVGGNGVPCSERMVSCCVERCVRFAWRNKGGGELCRSLHAVPRVRTKMLGGHMSAGLVVMIRRAWTGV